MLLRKRVLLAVFCLGAAGFGVLLTLAGGFRPMVDPELPVSRSVPSASTPVWATFSVGAEAGPGPSVPSATQPVSDRVSFVASPGCSAALAAGLGSPLACATQPVSVSVPSVSSPAWAIAFPVPGSSVSAPARPGSEGAGSASSEPSAPHQPAASPVQSVSSLIRSAAGPRECRFSGRARLHLAPAPPGTEVEAWVDGVRVAKGMTAQEGDTTVYRLTVDGAYVGKMVIFRFAGYPGMLLGQALCEAGAEQVVDLDEMVIGGCGGH